MRNYTVNQLEVGQKASISKIVTEDEVYQFASITGDVNPVHVENEYAKNTLFKKRIAHGMFSAALVSAVIGVKLPGPGCIYINQTLYFLAPVYFDDTITATVEVTRLILERNRVVLKTTCTNEYGKVVLDGEATVLAPIKPYLSK